MALNAREQLANVPVIAHETARMVQSFRSWPESYWSRPTYCPGWSAADAVAHLATGGDFYAQVITSGRSGEPKFAWGANSPAEAREARQALHEQVAVGEQPDQQALDDRLLADDRAGHPLLQVEDPVACAHGPPRQV